MTVSEAIIKATSRVNDVFTKEFVRNHKEDGAIAISKNLPQIYFFVGLEKESEKGKGSKGWGTYAEIVINIKTGEIEQEEFMKHEEKIA